jgi:hypothetical protein
MPAAPSLGRLLHSAASLSPHKLAAEGLHRRRAMLSMFSNVKLQMGVQSKNAGTFSTYL